MTRFDAAAIKTIVIKVGSSSIVRPDGEIRLGFLGNLVTQIARLNRNGRQVVLVTSGAIAMGFTRLGFKSRPQDIPSRQACAAAGQMELMQLYQRLFNLCGLHTGQVLLTREDIEDRRRYLNARETLLRLFSLNLVPIVNENDSVAVEEIQYGDNDLLSVLVAGLIDADLLVLMTDVEGVLREAGDGASEVVDTLDGPLDDWLSKTGASQSGLGSGGMRSKLEAAHLCQQYGIPAVIARGSGSTLEKVLKGEAVGTYLPPTLKRLESRRRWIAKAAALCGELTLDAGAVNAIRQGGKSLLPKGVTHCAGRFKRGEVVALLGPDGVLVARGVVRYGSADLAAVIGRRGDEIETILGYTYGDEVVHRDHLVLLS